MTSDWTIRQLLEWLAEEDRQHDPELRDRLALIESAATGSGWTREPSTIALIRSLANAARVRPALLSTTIGALGRGAHVSHPLNDSERDPIRAGRRG